MPPARDITTNAPACRPAAVTGIRRPVTISLPSTGSPRAAHGSKAVIAGRYGAGGALGMSLAALSISSTEPSMRQQRWLDGPPLQPSVQRSAKRFRLA